MNRCAVVVALTIVLLGCASSKYLTYEAFIEGDFRASENFKGSGKVYVSSLVVDKTKEQFIAKSSFDIDDGELDGYEIINYQVTYDGSYWVEDYQVFRFCTKSECKHKFILIIGVYA